MRDRFGLIVSRWTSGQHALASSQSICAVDARGVNLLSKRELEIVRSVAQGLTNHEIAKRLKL